MMILYINTTGNNLIEIGLKDKNKFLAKKKFKSHHTQAEKLLPGIAKLLRANNVRLSDLKSIEVVNQGGSFTSLRIGVVTANALAYALGIPSAGELGQAKMIRQAKRGFKVVEPFYKRQPVITKRKPSNLASSGTKETT